MNFNRLATQGNDLLHDLARRTGHPEEPGRTGILLRAVLHTLRDRITVAESLHLLAQLPAPLKLIYVESWKFLEEPIHLRTVEQFCEEVKMRQIDYGERSFSWPESTPELVLNVFELMREFISAGQWDAVGDQLPGELKRFWMLGAVPDYLAKRYRNERNRPAPIQPGHYLSGSRESERASAGPQPNRSERRGPGFQEPETRQANAPAYHGFRETGRAVDDQGYFEYGPAMPSPYQARYEGFENEPQAAMPSRGRWHHTFEGGAH